MKGINREIFKRKHTILHQIRQRLSDKLLIIGQLKMSFYLTTGLTIKQSIMEGLTRSRVTVSVNKAYTEIFGST